VKTSPSICSLTAAYRAARVKGTVTATASAPAISAVTTRPAGGSRPGPSTAYEWITRQNQATAAAPVTTVTWLSRTTAHPSSPTSAPTAVQMRQVTAARWQQSRVSPVRRHPAFR
jgi:hypothetical protein